MDDTRKGIGGGLIGVEPESEAQRIAEIERAAVEMERAAITGPLPDCMMPDGDMPCTGFRILQENRNRLHEQLVSTTRWASDAEARSVDHLGQAQREERRAESLAEECERETQRANQLSRIVDAYERAFDSGRPILLPVNQETGAVDYYMLERGYSTMDETEEFNMMPGWEWEWFVVAKMPEEEDG